MRKAEREVRGNGDEERRGEEGGETGEGRKGRKRGE